MSILDECEYQCRISSVLNRDIKSYGKKHLFDGNDDTCWNSDQGTPQWITIELKHRAHLSAFEIQFQGGFVGVNCSLELKDDGESVPTAENFYPEDVNSLQRFPLKNPRTAKEIKFVFNQSTDFFGNALSILRASHYEDLSPNSHGSRDYTKDSITEIREDSMSTQEQCGITVLKNRLHYNIPCGGQRSFQTSTSETEETPLETSYNMNIQTAATFQVPKTQSAHSPFFSLI